MVYPYSNPWNTSMSVTPQSQQFNDGSIMTVMIQGGEATANAYLVGSGNTVILIDFDSKKFWIKSNINGVPQMLRRFSFNEETIQNEPKESGSVTREEFDALSNNVATLSTDVRKLLSELGGTNHE